MVLGINPRVCKGSTLLIELYPQLKAALLTTIWHGLSRLSEPTGFFMTCPCFLGVRTSEAGQAPHSPDAGGLHPPDSSPGSCHFDSCPGVGVRTSHHPHSAGKPSYPLEARTPLRNQSSRKLYKRWKIKAWGSA